MKFDHAFWPNKWLRVSVHADMTEVLHPNVNKIHLIVRPIKWGRLENQNIDKWADEKLYWAKLLCSP